MQANHLSDSKVIRSKCRFYHLDQVFKLLSSPLKNLENEDLSGDQDQNIASQIDSEHTLKFELEWNRSLCPGWNHFDKISFWRRVFDV